jgi:hypothetical protein
MPDLSRIFQNILRSLLEWWPEPQKAEGLPSHKRSHLGLFLRGQAKRRRKATAKAKAKGKTKGKAKGKGKKAKADATGNPDGKKKKNQKKKGNKLKKAKGAKVIPNVETNFKKVGCGPLLIQQELERAKHLDQTKFATNLAFTENGDLCRLTIESCNQRPWKDFLEAAPGYFKCVSLGCGETLIL